MAAIELAAGALIGARYRLERRLGEGGMGVVWAAEDTVAGGRVALKIMKATDVPDARRRFLREGRAAAAVRHPGVVRILDVLEIASHGSAGARSTPGGSAESIASHGSAGARSTPGGSAESIASHGSAGARSTPGGSAESIASHGSAGARSTPGGSAESIDDGAPAIAM